MAERPPSHPRVAWEEVGAPQESISLLEPYEVSTVQPLQNGDTLPEDTAEHPELQLGWDSESTWFLSSCDSSDTTTVFGEYLQPSQMTDVLLVAIQALTADDIYDRQMGSNVLDMAMRDPPSWLTDVPKIMRSIHINVERIRTEPARHSLVALLLLLTKRCPREAVRSLLKISPTCDSAALAMWEVMISVPWALWRVLMELLSVLQDQRLRQVFSCVVEDACIYPLALLVCTDVETEEFAALYKAQRFLRRPSLVMLLLVLRGLITLSKTPETGGLSPLHNKETVCFIQARKMAVLLPDIMETLQDANTDVKMKALVFLRNMMAHMKREEASLIALQLAEKLLPLFDDESSQVREVSISLFKDVMKTVLERSKKKMKKTVQRVLLPLFIRMNDQIKSVAKASGDTLLACAEFLRWRKLSYLAKTSQTDLIGECLVLRDRSRVEEYVCQSLPYLKDAQASLREAAIRFIAILPLGKDPEFSISFLAAQAIYVLTSQDRKSRWSLRWLCCWLG
ncbi:hypothetical protein QYF61_003438 [Mycteria americana]|uniref:Uncharacterized protein n=1 Tax=Mycteria americana TaxID=33587 RepID=A0AAN7RR81_MYCAM|nr:hypothetical protein QYF61_003438 [Mycteria americana]